MFSSTSLVMPLAPSSKIAFTSCAIDCRARLGPTGAPPLITTRVGEGLWTGLRIYSWTGSALSASANSSRPSSGACKHKHSNLSETAGRRCAAEGARHGVHTSSASSGLGTCPSPLL
eukprot:scaffold4006_cov343-Prasinococcus_capsulatus_cf.AAC.2